MTPYITPKNLFIHPQKQRTVYRLTLVKSWNVEEMQAYSELISLGQPDFIEVKVGFNNITLLSQHVYSCIYHCGVA